jgi:hypothetical protein
VNHKLYQITASIVTYNNPIEEVEKAISSFSNTKLKVRMFISDNSEKNELKIFHSNNIEYIKNEKNLGFGRAHNKIIDLIKDISEYHLILNPDVYFNKGVLEKLYDFMQNNKNVGLVMPKVLYPNGEIQYLCKLLPTPFYLIARKFIPSQKILEKINTKYELHYKDYSQIMEVPNLSGCFMFVRTDVFNNIGKFDERFFMYMEDTDFVRRIGEKYKTIYFPEVQIYHEYKKDSYKNFKLMKYHMFSAIKYFNKWGWLFDKKRKMINKKILSDESLKKVKKKLDNKRDEIN